MKDKIDIELHGVLRWLLGILLIWAALSKLADSSVFFTALLGYRLPIPDGILRFVAIILPWMELLCGLLLLANLWKDAALSWTLVLFGIFLLVTAQAWVRGLDISCGCFNLEIIGIHRDGGLTKTIESVPFAFFRIAVLVGISFYLLWGRFSKDTEAA
jgi:putative oxidoreductase